jgi:hypothetical protein
MGWGGGRRREKVQAGPTCGRDRACKIQTDRQTEKYREVEEGKGNWMGQTERSGETEETSG